MCDLINVYADSFVSAGMRMSVLPALILLSLTAAAQTFDAASIHPNNSGRNGGSIVRSDSRVTVTNISLRDCIAAAYGIPTGRDYQLSGPGWLDTENFDIVATFQPGTSRAGVWDMMKKLLADRFGVKVHYETRELQAYALTVSPKGHRLKSNTSTGDDGAFIYSDERITFRAIDMAGLTNRLSSSYFHLNRPVVNKTELEGAYDFVLNWSPNDPAGPSLFTALEEQLGLRLETQKLPFQILIVDAANRVPSDN